MRIIKSLLIFYQKLIMPTLFVSILLNLMGITITGNFSFKILGISYILLGLFFHFFTYEIRNSGEYYFYFNLGINKYMLWLSTLVFNLVIGVIIAII